MQLKKTKSFGILFIPLFIITGISSCGNAEPYQKEEGMIWNTLYHITYKGNKSLGDSVLQVLDKVGASLSVFNPHSLVSELNSSLRVKTDSDLLIVYDESLKINHLSHGNFDPTLSPLIDAWGFGIGHTPSADTLALDSLMKFVGIDKTHREGDFIIKDDIRTRFNFSAIAKGYGCDAVGEMFKRNGVKDFMVEIGGEIILSGESPSGHPWKIAVDAPMDGNLPGQETAVILSITDKGIATSGNYRNYREDNGIKFAHTISPVTGRPFVSEILSATVISASCMEADAIATACMAGSLQDAKELLSATESEGMLILTDSIWSSPGFSHYVISEVSEPEGKDRN